MSPRPQIDHIRRPQMLAAAAEVIAERGVAGTRVADVAERAGTSPAAVLYWFATKDELLLAALIEDEQRFYDAVTERLAGLESPAAKLLAIFESSASESEWPLWVELWGRALREPSAAEERQRLDDRWRGLLAEVIEEGRRVDEFGGVPPASAAVMLAALIDGLALQVTLGDAGVAPETMVDACVSTADALLGVDLRAAAHRTAVLSGGDAR